MQTRFQSHKIDIWPITFQTNDNDIVHTIVSITTVYVIWPHTVLDHVERAIVGCTDAERVNVVLGIYKHYPGSISSLRQYTGYTSLSRTLTSIVIRYLHSRLSRAWLWSRDRLKENGGDRVLFLWRQRSWVMFVYTQDDIYPFWVSNFVFERTPDHKKTPGQTRRWKEYKSTPFHL
jgi:hypothetical protein